MPFLTTALALGAVGAAGSLGGAAIAGSAASNAASTQANASENAAQLQYDAEQKALAFQEQQWQQTQANAQPWLQTGGSAELEMARLLGLPGPSNGATPNNPFPGSSTTSVPGGASPYSANGSTFNPAQFLNHDRPMGANGRPAVAGAPRPTGGPVMATGANGAQPGASPGAGVPGQASGQLQPFAPWTTPFVAPTAAQAAQYPGYQFQLDQGMKALENSAAAKGTLLTGDFAQGAEELGQNLAQSDYTNVYNQALGQYQQSYNIYQNNQANQWNRLASLAGMGQTQASQLSSAGLQMGSNVGNTLLGAASNIGNYGQNAAAATASGYVGAGNAYGGALSSLGSNFGSTLLMSQLLANNPYSSTAQIPSASVDQYEQALG